MPLSQFSTYYPISLDEVKARVARKFKRQRSRQNQVKEKRNLLDISALSNVKELTNDFGEKITRVDGDIPVELPVNKGDRFLFISYHQSVLSHGLHKYPAKFFPELPRWLIKKYSNEGDYVLDPFAGSGTTNIEALLNDRNSIGIDVDPFSRMLARVKTTPLDADELLKAQNILIKRALDYHPKLVASVDIPDFPYRDNWFENNILLELAFLRREIQNLDVQHKTKDFLSIVFSSIIRSISNADDNCTRTVVRKSLNKQILPGDALRKFIEALLNSVPKIIELSKLIPEDIEAVFPDNMDARRIEYHSKFDLAVTSPPYVNAVDYPRTHQLEMYWLNLAEGSLAPLKRKHVGTESVSAREYGTLHKIDVPEADAVLKSIYNLDPRRAFIAYKYLLDMRLNLIEVQNALKPKGRYAIVVGNNRIRGHLFENWRYIMKIAEQVGFEIETYFGSEIIRHFIKVPREERIDTDWVVVLRKS